jgi:hypothetical protein
VFPAYLLRVSPNTSAPYLTMISWHDLRWSVYQGFWPPYNRLPDEECLELDSEPEEKQRHEPSSVWPKTSSGWLLLLLVDLAIVLVLLHSLEPLITLLRLNDRLFSPKVTLPSSSTAHIGNCTRHSNRIPLILHQTTATDVIPEFWVQSQQSCQKAYADFEYKVRWSIFLKSRNNLCRRESSVLSRNMFI